MTREEAIAFHGEVEFAKIEAEHNSLFGRYCEDKFFGRCAKNLSFYDWKFERGLTKAQLTPTPAPEREPVTFTD